METVVMRNRPLAGLFARAASVELDVLADIITDKGEGRFALSTKAKKVILENKRHGTLQSIASMLEQEIRRFGGHTVVNVFRSEDVDYREVAADVAMHLGASVSKSDDIFAIEEQVVQLALQKYSKCITVSQDWADQSALLTQIVKRLIHSKDGFVKRLIANGAREATVVRAASPILRPVAAVIPSAIIGVAGITAYHAQKPAFRITIPAVIHIANIRRCQVEAEFYYYQRSLRACL